MVGSHSYSNFWINCLKNMGNMKILVKKMGDNPWKIAETHFQNAKTRFQKAKTRFKNAETA